MTFPPSRRRKPVAARWLMRALLVAVIPLVAACKDSPTPPSLAPYTPAELAVFMPALHDARVRIVPALANEDMAHRVDVQLKILADNLGTRNVDRSRQAVDQAIVVLDNYMKQAGATASDIPEVGAIQLVLYHAGVLLRMQIDPARLPYIGIPIESLEQ